MPHATTKVLTAHVPLSLAEKVDQVAARLERSRAWADSLSTPDSPPFSIASPST